uniref:PID domain-containing protein n=1 Tax=Cyclopterus lumpus TaxID=8103 RepID=A0A8C3AM28_CYCLU
FLVIIFLPNCLQDMADYIAYVAKDLVNQRACHILECPRGRAGEVINSIGQAFETRFRQLLNHTPSLLSSNPSAEETITDQKATRDGKAREHRDYYNVIPGKTPPAGGIENLRITSEESKPDPDIDELCHFICRSSWACSRTPQLLVITSQSYCARLGN